MKKILAWLLALAMLCCMGAGALADGEEEYWGSYGLVDMVTGEERSEEEEAMMAMMASLITLEIEEDGHAILNIMGEEQEAWFDFDAGTMTVTSEEGSADVPFTYEDGIISFGDEEMMMYFEKDAGAAPASGAFDYYTVVSMIDGETGAESDEEGELFVFESGAALLTMYGETLEMAMDFDTMTVEVNGQTGIIVVDGDALEITDENGWTARFLRDDPGYVGSYVLTGMSGDTDEEAAEAMSMLAAMGMMPTLTIQEDGSGLLEMYGQEIGMVFDFDAMTVTSTDESGEDTTAFTYDKGQLVIEAGGESLTFCRSMETADVGAAAD